MTAPINRETTTTASPLLELRGISKFFGSSAIQASTNIYRNWNKLLFPIRRIWRVCFPG